MRREGCPPRVICLCTGSGRRGVANRWLCRPSSHNTYVPEQRHSRPSVNKLVPSFLLRLEILNQPLLDESWQFEPYQRVYSRVERTLPALQPAGLQTVRFLTPYFLLLLEIWVEIRCDMQMSQGGFRILFYSTPP